MGGDLAVGAIGFVAFVLVQTSCADGAMTTGEVAADEERLLGYGIERGVEGGCAGCTGVDHSDDDRGWMGRDKMIGRE